MSKNAEVEVVAGAEFSFRHNQVISFSSDDYPDGSAAGLENVLFNSVFFEGFEGFCESLPEKVVKLG